MPFKGIKQTFELENSGVEILRESAGSVDCIRKITELKKECDVLALADYALINKMMIPDYASWNIQFAGNEMCIVFNEKSKFASKINVQNWIEILAKSDVSYRRSDLNVDPCGGFARFFGVSK